MRASLLLLGTAAIVASAGCPAEETPPEPGSECKAGFVGDPAKEPVVELRALTADGTDVPIADGDSLAVILPPQGGRVAFVGVRATNVDACGAQLVSALRDLSTTPGQVRVEGRTVNLNLDATGWASTAAGKANFEDPGGVPNYANVPLCPNQWAEVDVFDQTFELEVTLTDRRGKAVTKKARVTPRCAEPGEKAVACRCLCRKGYVLGETCNEDAGAGR